MAAAVPGPEPTGCAKLANPSSWKTKGTIAQRAGFLGDGYVVYNKSLYWDRLLLDTEAVRSFYLNYSTLAKTTSVPLSLIRWTFRMITLPVMTAVTLLGGVYGYIADRPEYVGAAVWAFFKSLLLVSQVCIALFVMSQTTAIVYASIYGGLAILNELHHGWTVDPHGKFDNAINFPFEDYINGAMQPGIGGAIKDLILP